MTALAHPIHDLPTGHVMLTSERCPFTTAPLALMTRETFDDLPTQPQPYEPSLGASRWWREGSASCSAQLLNGAPQPELVARRTGRGSLYGEVYESRVVKIVTSERSA